MNKKVRYLSLMLMTVLFFGVQANAYKFDFVTVGDVVKKIQEAFGKLESYQANFTIMTEKMGKKSQQNGQVKYKSSDKLLVNFYNPSGQKIIANSDIMWIYIPSMNVVAEQDLKNKSGIFSNTESGLKRLFSKYHYKFDSKDQPETLKDGSKYYTIQLKQKESRSGYRTMKLWVDADYMIVRASGETSTGKKVDISFSDIKKNIDLPNGLFKFEVPSRARVIKNPMISEE